MAALLYRAGTHEGPLFEVLNNNGMLRDEKSKLPAKGGKRKTSSQIKGSLELPHVWLITDPRLYYPLDQDASRITTRTTPRLWKTCISSIPDTLIKETHPNFEEIVLLKLKEPPREEHGEEKLKEILGSIKWKPASVPVPCKQGMSRMNVSVLVHAVLEYLKDHRPTTPQESNFQAELKAVSHWYWFKDNEPMNFVSRHFDDRPFKKIAKLALKRWTQKLNEMETQAQKLPFATQGDNDLSGSIEEQISDLEESIFSMEMYYGKALEEADDDNLPSFVIRALREDDRYPKIGKRVFPRRSPKKKRKLLEEDAPCPPKRSYRCSLTQDSRTPITTAWWL